MEFQGSAARLSGAAVARAANGLGCSEAAIRAVIEVESRGGFDEEGRPHILFERHYFHRLTDGRFGVAHPELSCKTWGGYGRASAQYGRLARAIALDREAALRSASWGMFQIMGDNFQAAGFADVERFVTAMMEGEDRHLQAFIAFVRARRLDGALARCDWRGFARGYNGRAFARNRYDEKLASAFARHAGPPLLQRGDRGTAVARLQKALAISEDGIFGRETEAAVTGFQRRRRLVADGIAGLRTWTALNAAS
ncbi:N-acetylmuramidase domain-containing protein [Novosphingopyxis sp.]|uniref:N-acetylmuramidase domain-containing protein n=1 Tax=Novosphingopyxis sp. TaxID=2709690 RepID=UPI003B5A12AB